MVQQGTFFGKRNGLLYGSCHKPTKFTKSHCDTIKRGIKKWMGRQESFAKSGMPACAKSALVDGGEDTLFKKAAPKKNKKSNKSAKKNRGGSKRYGNLKGRRSGGLYIPKRKRRNQKQRRNRRRRR